MHRNNAIFRFVSSAETTTSQTWVVRPPCASDPSATDCSIPKSAATLPSPKTSVSSTVRFAAAWPVVSVMTSLLPEIPSGQNTFVFNGNKEDSGLSRIKRFQVMLIGLR